MGQGKAFHNGAALFQNGRLILEFQNGAAPFQNGADSKMGHNMYSQLVFTIGAMHVLWCVYPMSAPATYILTIKKLWWNLCKSHYKKLRVKTFLKS